MYSDLRRSARLAAAATATTTNRTEVSEMIREEEDGAAAAPVTVTAAADDPASTSAPATAKPMTVNAAANDSTCTLIPVTAAPVKIAAVVDDSACTSIPALSARAAATPVQVTYVADEPVSTSVPTNSVSSRQSSCSKTSKVSGQSLRRVMEAEAARMKLELEMKRIELEKAMVQAKLEENLAKLEEANTQTDLGSVRSRRTQKWVEETVKSRKYEVKIDAEKPDQSACIEKLTEAITTALKMASIPPATGTSTGNDKLLGRLAAKDLPTFSGDPLDWLRFKNAFQTTTKIGQYTEEENVSRLQHCLRGDAWEAVAARLIATKSASEIMSTLEMRFGRPDIVLGHLIDDMKKVPKLTGTRSEVIVLATKVDNCSAAIQASGHMGYLYSPELANEIIGKLTEPIFYRWLDFTDHFLAGEPKLHILAKFLMREAENICRGGYIDAPSTSSRVKTAPTYPNVKRSVFLTNPGEEDSEDETSVNAISGKGTEKKCVFCDTALHSISDCSGFKKLGANERWEWVCKKRLCFRCLKTTHRRDRCKSRIKCKSCSAPFHHSLLHRDDLSNKEEEENKDTEVTANIWSNGSSKVFLKVLPVELQGPAGSVMTYALLDEGSTISLIEKQIAEKIGASGPDNSLNIQGAVGPGNNVHSQMITMKIKTIDGDYERLQRVRTVDTMKLPCQAISVETVRKYDHLKEIPLEDFEGKPTMLLGQDNWPLIITREVREGKPNEPVASLTRLGWVMHGFSTSASSNAMTEFSFHAHCDEELHEVVKNYFYYDNLGVKNNDLPRLTPDEHRAIRILDTKSKLIDNRWETGLLWRSDDVILPNNRRNAECRLRTIEKMMDADPRFAADYTKQVNNMLEKKYSEEAKENPAGRVWYLPHFGVRNPNKPGKLRLVFDAKAETKGISLNTELLTGPDLLNSLLGVLLRFREKAIAVTADIREMFLQVKINKEDQNSQCFLWREMDRDKPPRTYKMTSMTFGATSSPCTATYIIRRNADRYAESHPRAVEAIKKRHYVDDYLDSLDDEEEMKQLVADVVMIHAAGGFDIRGWASNKPSVLPKSKNDNEPVTLLQESDVQRTLGLNWHPVPDTLGFDLSLKKIDPAVIGGIRPPTKREMLKVTMSVFDPLGMLCPLLIRSKILLQAIWRAKIKWDQQVDETIVVAWRKWLEELIECRSFSIPRCYGFRSEDLQIHVFVDASEQAYASVAYLRENEKVVFVAGKSRVAPLKSGSTIPRLELQAALMGARLGHTIRKEHSFSITKCYYWTDSQTVWRWILNNPRQRQVFISNRLSEIDELTKTDEWRWLPGNLNPADAATRSTKHAEELWITGPEFLRQSEATWPIPRPQYEEETEPPTDITVVFATSVEDKLIDDTRFSNWRKLVRSLARAILFTEICRKRRHADLSVDHEKRAKDLILKQAQNESFGEDIALIKIGRQPRDKLRPLNPEFDTNGLLHAKSRLEAARNLPVPLKRPVILEAKHNVSKLIIESKHRQLGHYGTATLINELRQEFYIFKLRTTVRSMISNCVICKLRRARCEQPKMAGLPAMRLEHHCRPFTFCGVDLFGPMTVTIGRRHEKRWAALFTCFSTRAVHIELVSSLNTDSTIMAIRRMAARRGLPKQIHSDNGTNFRSADKEMTAALKDKQMIDKVTVMGIRWTFNPPSAPHMGGVWERLVRSIKIALGAILNSRCPKEEVLITLLAEAENIVNSRPLTEVSLDPDEEEALTPNHFLLGTSSNVIIPGTFSDRDLNLRKQWRTAQRLTDHFWTRWIREYLPILRARKKWTTDSRNLAVGDLVLIVDGSLPRNMWPRGRIAAVVPGRDGSVRIVDVATAGGHLRRPASKIVRLMTVKAAGSEEENVTNCFGRQCNATL